MDYWFEYVKVCYDLVIESERKSSIILRENVETYLVHLMARNFKRTDLGSEPVAIKILKAINENNKYNLKEVGDECLLIHGLRFKKSKWPSNYYYQDIGVTAYGLANHIMEKNFIDAGKILSIIFKENFEKGL